MLVREAISFERGADPKKQLGIGEYARIRDLKTRDILTFDNKTFPFNTYRYVVIVDVVYNGNNLYIEYAGFGNNLDAAKRNAKSSILNKYFTNSDTKTLKEWDKKIIDIIKN